MDIFSFLLKYIVSLGELLSGRGVDDTEDSDPLGLQSDDCLARVGGVGLGQSGVGAVLRLPLEFALLHGGEVLVVAQGALGDGHVTRGDSSISALVESRSVGRNIESRSLSWSAIEQV